MMNSEYCQTFSDAFLSVMSQFGLDGFQVTNRQFIIPTGLVPDVNVNLKITGDVHGDVTYSMDEVTAKRIASAMMGMGVEEFDDIAKSAVCELGNMLAANSCTGLASHGITSDISTPTLFTDSDKSTFNWAAHNCIELKNNNTPFFIVLSLTA